MEQPGGKHGLGGEPGQISGKTWIGCRVYTGQQNNLGENMDMAMSLDRSVGKYGLGVKSGQVSGYNPGGKHGLGDESRHMSGKTWTGQ